MTRTLPAISLALTLSLAVSNTLLASPANSGEDSNIVISSKTDRYSFEEGEKDHPVIVRQESKTQYYCSELRSSIVCEYAEMIYKSIVFKCPFVLRIKCLYF
jgi:hypothetical protein